jgi:hypothetical protein
LLAYTQPTSTVPTSKAPRIRLIRKITPCTAALMQAFQAISSLLTLS